MKTASRDAGEWTVLEESTAKTDDYEALAEVRKALEVMERDYKALASENALMAKEHQELLAVENKMLALIENESCDNATSQLERDTDSERACWEATSCSTRRRKTGSMSSSFSTASTSAASISCWSSVSTDCTSAESDAVSRCSSKSSASSEDAESTAGDVQYYSQRQCPASQDCVKSLAEKCKSAFVIRGGSTLCAGASSQVPVGTQIRVSRRRQWR